MRISLHMMISNLKAQLAADPRKATILSVLILIMVGVYVRLFFRAPLDAAAEGVFLAQDIVNSVPVRTEINPHVGDTLAGAGRVATDSSRGYEPQPFDGPVDLGHLARDVFSVDWMLFPSAPTTRNTIAAGDPTFDWCKRLGRVALEEQKKQRAKIARAQRDASRLTLQSTIVGQRSFAIINGEFLRPGSEIGGFRLVHVENRDVVLERNNVRITLTLP